MLTYSVLATRDPVKGTKERKESAEDGSVCFVSLFTIMAYYSDCSTEEVEGFMRITHSLTNTIKVHSILESSVHTYSTSVFPASTLSIDCLNIDCSSIF